MNEKTLIRKDTISRVVLVDGFKGVKHGFPVSHVVQYTKRKEVKSKWCGLLRDYSPAGYYSDSSIYTSYSLDKLPEGIVDRDGELHTLPHVVTTTFDGNTITKYFETELLASEYVAERFPDFVEP